MQTNNSTEEDTQQQKRQSAERQQHDPKDDHGKVMEFGDPDIELVFREIGHVVRQGRSVVVHGSAGQNPPHVCPPLAIYGRVRIAWLVGILMMNAMRCNPEYRPTLKCQGCADGKEVFNPFWGPVASMGEQPMIAHTNSETSRHPPQEDRHEECFPRKEKQSRKRSDVKCDHEKGGNPVNLIVGGRFLGYGLDVHGFLLYLIRYRGHTNEAPLSVILA